uniref:Zf-C3H1 domain-containing protein n=1 Tax=Anopheles melas TaxID=34690 RepID=A0A182UKV0_9DIPT
MPTSLTERTRFLCTMDNPDEEKLPSAPSPSSGDLPDGLVLISSGSEAQDAVDEDHEEGEIQDEDEDEQEQQQQQQQQQQQELEDISSEEESTIRERMAALEAMDKKLGMMKKKIANRSIYEGYLDEEDVINGKENYCYYYPQHQQSSYRTQKTYKSSAPAGREDSRHGTSKREKRTSGTKRHAEKPPKEKPVKRSSHRHRKRRKYASRSPSPAQRRPVSTDSEPETTAVDREYLKIACGIGNSKSGRLPGDRNPLKKKLLLQAAQKRKSATAGKRTPVAIVSLDSSSSEHDMELEDDEGDGEEEEEEEELKLRLLALSTKPVVREAGLSDIISELQIPSPPPPPAIQLQTDPTADDQSAEELRLIALKTAILKKHATRCKRRELDNEQPYSPSDDIVLSPVQEMPPPYDPSGVYSDGRDSVELLDDDTDDVQIVEPQYDHIDLVDSDDNGNDMEISPLASPLGGTDRAEQDMEEDSQQPIDMELASSSENSRSGRPSPIGDGRRSGMDQKLLLLHTAGPDSCDSALFHRRGDLVPESPPVTPDSMEEAEAEALRHLLLTKMRQKQSKRQEQEAVVRDEMAVPAVRDDALETVPTEASSPEVPPQREPEVEEEEENEEIVHTAPMTQHDPARPNLITLIDQKQPVRKRRKKSLAIASATDVPAAPVTPASPSPTLPELPTKPAKAAPALVQAQKLVNNPNKLINLNRSAAPSPPMLPVTAPLRTESPKELTTVDTFVSRPVPKLVIQLGHSDSDSDVDFGGATTETGGAVNGTAMAPTARFEEQLDKFLKSVRSKSTPAGTNEAAEGGEEELPHSERAGSNSGKSLHSIRQQQASKHAAKKQPTSSSTMATPTAVKHLSKSAQLEYMKLVARMAQLERDKLTRQQTQAPGRRTTDNGSSTSTRNAVPRDNSVPKVVVAASEEPVSSKSAAEQRTEPKSGKSPGRRKQSHSGSTPTKVAEAQEPVLDPIERKLQQIRASLPNLTEASRNRLLLTAETQLENHSDSFLSDLEQHNATIIEAQQARRELYHIESRIDLLREKLALLEKVHERQRVRTRDTLANLHTTRKKILSGRKRSGELERMCIQIGRAVKGESYQMPVGANGREVQQQMRILIAEMQQLKSIRKPTLEEFKVEMIANHKRRLANAYDNEQSEERQQVVPEEEQEEQEEDEEEAEEQEEEVQSPPVDSAVVDAEQKCASEMSEQTEELCEAGPQTVPNEEIEQEDAEGVQEPSEQLEQLDMQSIEAAKEAESDSKPLEPLSVQTDAPAAADKDDQENSATVQAEPQSEVQMWQEKETVLPAPVPDQCQMDDTANGTDELVVGEAYRIEKYTSPLMSLKQSAQNIPTDGILCPYELGGQCVDRDCKYEHFNQRAA